MKCVINRSGESAHLDTKATAAVMAFVPALEGRRHWLKSGGLQFEASGRNIEVLRSTFPGVEIEDLSAASQPTLAQEVASAFDLGRGTYKSLTTPFPHQLTGHSKAQTKFSDEGGAFAYFMEQGTGKTKAAIDLAGELYCADKIDAVLVMAKKGVHRQWIESELPAHCGIEWTGAFWPTYKKMVPTELLEPGHLGELKVFTINWDGAKTKHGLQACLEFVNAHKGRVFIIGDETQEIKNAQSARWKAAVRIAKAAGRPFWRMALTGTPVAKDLTDEWAQLKWLDEDILGIRYVSAFRNEYCIMGGFEGRVVVGQKNMEKFRSKVDPFTYRVTKDEIGILPKTYRMWQFDLLPVQRKAIQEMRKTLEMQIDSGEIVSAANAAVAMVKIQQASNGFVIDELGNCTDLVGVYKNPRIKALIETLEAYEGPTVIWARFRHDMRLIAEALTAFDISHVEYHGGTSDKDRAANVQSFLKGDARVFLSNPQAGGTGLNLQTGGCQHAIYYSNSYNAIDRWQSEDRIHRIGTKGAVVYTDLTAKGSIDKAILSNLKRKQGLANLAIGDIRKILEDL